MQTATRIANRRATKPDDVKSIMSYCHYLMMKGQLIGNLCFDGHKPTSEENFVAEQCRRMCDKISVTIEFCKINEVAELLDYFDIAYRIGHKCPPDNTFIAKHKRRVFNVWRSGDRTIDESTIFGIIASEVLYHPEKADREYFLAYRSIKDKWITTLKRFDRFPDATSYENYQRLALMMRENIDSEFGGKSESVKHQWYERNKIEDFSKVSTPILRSYRCFASSLFPAVLDYAEVTVLDNHILTELSNRPDLPPHDREAFSLALRYNNQLVEN